MKERESSAGAASAAPSMPAAEDRPVVSDDSKQKSAEPGIIATVAPTATAAATMAAPEAKTTEASGSTKGGGEGGGGGGGVALAEKSADIKGGLGAEAVHAVVRAALPRLRACYQGALKGAPKLAGRLGVKFTINASGAVESASSSQSTITDAPMTKCVLDVTHSLVFPSPNGGGSVQVWYPIDFTTAG